MIISLKKFIRRLFGKNEQSNETLERVQRAAGAMTVGFLITPDQASEDVITFKEGQSKDSFDAFYVKDWAEEWRQYLKSTDDFELYANFLDGALSRAIENGEIDIPTIEVSIK